MTARQSTPSSENSHSDSGVRKRVCKACDRCRLKKSKCDGAKPCGRCRADNTLCVFGERKKAHDKVYPKGYVEMLEQQQTWLVNGLQELYRRLLDGEGWQGEPLKCEPNGHPLTHDLLMQLGALDSRKHERFEESADALQSELWRHSAGHMQRQDSSDTSSESAHSPIVPPQFSDPFASRTALPQTPTTSLRIDVPQSTIKTEPHLPPSNPYTTAMQQPQPMSGVINPLQLQSNQMHGQWNSGYGYDEMDFSAQFVNFEDPMASPMFSRQVLTAPFLDSKNDYEEMNQYLNTQLEIA
ncbi:hypothetical protein BJX68DRAFT_243654 [Aspergillus pseudodeflectus]|uniref:Zn(2)-C6 fungal-type domain-containing protein n=1 Tax=Aspergillus pseudodeflectus TaxID=176178 RepID=A0ABR4JW25_9EURO